MKLLKSKLHYLCDCFRYFWNNGWIFRQDNTKSLEFKADGSAVSNEFTIDQLGALSWEPYLYNTVYGVYYYVLKESASLRVFYDIPGWESVLGKSNRLFYQHPVKKLLNENSEPVLKVEAKVQRLTPSNSKTFNLLNNRQFEKLLTHKFSGILINKARVKKLSSILSHQNSQPSVIYISKEYNMFDPLILRYIAKLYNLPVPGLVIGNGLETLEYSLINRNSVKLRIIKKPDSLCDENISSVESDLVKALTAGDSIYLNSNSDTSQNALLSLITKSSQLANINPVYIVPIGIAYESIQNQNLTDLVNSNQLVFPESENKKKGVCYFNLNDPILVASDQSETKLNTAESIIDQLQVGDKNVKVITPIHLLSTILYRFLQSSPKQNVLKFSYIRSQMRQLRSKLKELGQIVDINDFEDMDSVLNYSIEVLGRDCLKICQTENGDQLLEVDDVIKLEKMLIWYSKGVVEVLK